MKIYLSGSEGFLGKSIYKEFSRSHDVKCCDIVFGLTHDIREKYWVFKAFHDFRPEIVIHCAALTGVPLGEKFPGEYYQTNVIGTRNICDAMQEYKTKGGIFFSSSSVYGNQTCPINEDTPKEPISEYGKSKVQMEWEMWNYSFRSIIVRPFTVYGDNPRVDSILGRWITAAKEGKELEYRYPKGGDFSRGYTPKGALVKAIEKMVESVDDWYGIVRTYNLGGSERISLKMIKDIFEAQFAPQALNFKEIEAPEWEIRESYADCAKADKDWGWNELLKGYSYEEEVKKIIYEKKIEV